MLSVLTFPDETISGPGALNRKSAKVVEILDRSIGRSGR
jgi:hypothetical protein